MADEDQIDGSEIEEDENLDGEPAKKKVDKKVILFIALPILCIVGSVVGYLMSSPDGGKAQKSAEGKVVSEVRNEKGEIVKVSAFYDLKELVVNLNTSLGERPALAKIKISLEVENNMDIPALDALMPRIVDSLLGYLKELRPAEVEGAQGLYRLKEEMLMRVSDAVSPIKIKDVKFTQFEVQY